MTADFSGQYPIEARQGEMAALGEVPFGQYYGSVDATPLFVILAAAYYERTGERSLIEEIWPAILAAVAWMRNSGDADGDGWWGLKSGAGCPPLSPRFPRDHLRGVGYAASTPPQPVCRFLAGSRTR